MTQMGGVASGPLRTKVISVIIVNWDRRELLRSCLQSLERQTISGFEVILVDNGSRDGSVEMVRTNFTKHIIFSVQLIANTTNLGFCTANNQGIAAARGELIALLNNDAEAEPQWLDALASAFREPDVGMAASKILVYEDPSRIDKAGHLIYPDGQNRGRGTGEVDQGQYDRIEEVLWPDGCAAMYRRSMLDEIGGFDEDFFAYADDAELGLRARAAGWRCLYVPTAVVRHHRGATLGLDSAARLELIERNRVLLVVKHFPARMLVAAPFYFVLRLAAGMRASVRGVGETRRFRGWRGKLFLAGCLVRANLQALKMVPAMLRKRKALAGKRRLTQKQLRELLLRHKISLNALAENAN
jgi:GT2 family glycosyltransferase